MKNLAFTILLSLPGAFQVHACDCAGRLGLKDADAVFAGTVIGIRNVSDSLVGRRYEFTFKVTRWIKGAQRPAICKVYEDDIQGPACGAYFEIDHEYELYARDMYTTTLETDRALFTDVCTETRELTPSLR